MIVITIFNNKIVYVANAYNSEQLVKEINDEMESYFGRTMTDDEKEQLFGDGEGDGEIFIASGEDKFTFTFLLEGDETEIKEIG